MRLQQLDPGVQANVKTGLHQRQHVAACRQLLLGKLDLSVQSAGLKIGAGNLVRKEDASRLGIGLHGTGLSQRRVQSSAVLTKKIKFPATTDQSAATVPDRARQWRWYGAIGRVALAAQVDRQAQLGSGRGLSALDASLRPHDPRLNHLQCGVVAQRLLNEAVQLLIRQGAPPLRLRQHGTGLRTSQTQRLGITQNSLGRQRLGCVAAQTGATGHRQHAHGQ